VTLSYVRLTQVKSAEEDDAGGRLMGTIVGLANMLKDLKSRAARSAMAVAARRSTG
jgi:hypothetical protein